MADRPYRLITTDDPNRTFGEALDAGGVRYFASMLAAANAFAKATERFKTVVYDDGCTARELNRNEQRLLENVCAKLGYDVAEVEADPDPHLRHVTLPQPGCAGKAHCQVHMAEQRKANRSAFDGFYSSKPWRMQRRRQLFAYPLCQFVEDGEECGLLADSVHHIVELEDGGAPRDPANLMSLCRSHHSVIHAQTTQDQGEGRNVNLSSQKSRRVAPCKENRFIRPSGGFRCGSRSIFMRAARA